jgi:hypothetical protein
MAGLLQGLPQPFVHLLHQLCVHLVEVDSVVLRMANRSAVDMAKNMHLVDREFAVLHKRGFTNDHRMRKQTPTIIHDHVRSCVHLFH